VRDLLLDDKNTLSFPQHEPILLQLPGTLPFADIKPHTGKVLEQMLEKLAISR
jgi:hypothetical protein